MNGTVKHVREECKRFILILHSNLINETIKGEDEVQSGRL